jgi:hypothetical protein
MNGRLVTLTVGSLSLSLAVSACQAGSRTNGFTPAQGEGSQVLTSVARVREVLYATTLDWNTGAGTVYYYAAYNKNSSPLGSLAIASGYPNGVWTDSKGDVYVAVVNSSQNNGRGYINVYTPKLAKLLRTYTAGLDGPSGGTFDAAGNMYVSNVCGRGPSISCYVFARPRGAGRPHAAPRSGSLSGYVAIYPPGATQPSSYLQSPINIAVGVALDSSNNVFAVNNTGGIAWNVIEFAAGSQQGHVVPFKGLPKNRWVGADTFNPFGALVISVNSAIDFFPHERGKPAQSLTKGVVAADGLAYGPDGTLFAGNYEFEQNEGNIIAFPPGATSPQRTYAVPYNNGVISVAIGKGG